MTAKRIWLSVTVLVVGVTFFGALTLFSWTIGEEHFDRPDEGFDRFTAEIESLPGVTVEATERWVEAPTFSQPTSWVDLRVDQANLPALLDAACATEYSDAVTWSVRVTTRAGDVVSMHDDPLAPDRAAGRGDGGGGIDRSARGCVDVGFDAVALVDEVDRVRPGVDLQARVSEDGRFGLLSLADYDIGLSALLPVVAHADDLRQAAGLDASRSVEVSAANLSLIIEPGEHERYSAELSSLAEVHGVTSFWADGGGTQIDGIEKVQIIAPEEGHAAIEAAIRASGLHIADLPVRFISPAS